MDMANTMELGALVETILAEGPIGMTGAARLYGSFRSGRPTHPSTPTRHHLHGVRLPCGAIIRLEAVRIGGRLMTSKAAVTRFIIAQQAGAHKEAVPIGQPTPSARNSAAASASRELDAMGI
jgi:hypothetical protein